MKSIIHVITTLGRGGAETQLRLLASEQIRSGKRVMILFLKDNPELRESFRINGIEVGDFLWKKHPLAQILLLKRFLKNGEYLVHAHLPRAQLIAALAIGKKDLFLSRHDEEIFFPNANRLLSRLLTRFVASRSQACIAISNSVRNKITSSNEFPRDFPLPVVHYGYEKMDYASTKGRGELRSNFGISQTLIFGTVGRLVKQKDYPTLLKGFKLFHDEHKDSALLIVGDGPLRGELKVLSQELSLEGCVYWMGSRSDVSTFYALMDVFVLASTTEGFGLVLLEAMSKPLPIIGSDIETINEVLGSTTGLLFDAGDEYDLYKKMSQVSETKIREKMTSRSKIRVDAFDSGKMEKQIDKIYRKFGDKQ